jgi:hypothetical protein
VRARAPAVTGASGTVCVQEETVTGWYDWRMAFTWLMAVAIASAIYFFPIARLVDSLGD